MTETPKEETRRWIAITDLYDPYTGKLLVRHANWILAVFSVLGFLAFSLVGFFGFDDDPQTLKGIHLGGWPLFVWLCLLMFAIQGIVLRHKVLHWRRNVLFVIMLLGVFVVAGWYSGQFMPLFQAAISFAQQKGLVFLALLGLMMVLVALPGSIARSRVSLRSAFDGSMRWLLFPLLLLLLLADSLLRAVLFSFIWYCRSFVWPTLALIDVFGLGLIAFATDHYLHYQTSGDPRAAFLSGLIDLGIISGGLGISVACTAAVPAILIFRWRPAENALRALVLLVFGVIQILLPVLILFNAIVWIVGITSHTPYFQPSAGNILTIGAFLFLLIRAYLRRGEGLRVAVPAAETPVQ